MNDPRQRDSSSEDLEIDWGGRSPRGIANAALQTPEVAGDSLVRGRGAPGDPRHMSVQMHGSLQPLLEGHRLTVRQALQWPEILVGWETRKCYEVADPTGHPMVYAGESGEGLVSSLARNFWPFRKLRLELMTLDGLLTLALNRPWSFFFARFDVEAWDGRPLGRICQRLRIFGKALDLMTPAGNLLATARSSLFHPWTFHFQQQGIELAIVRKRWSNFWQETMTDADNYEIELLPALRDGKLRQMILAAALAIDLTWFEDRNTKKSGLLRGGLLRD